MCAKKSSDKNLFFSENFYSEMRLDNMLFSAIVRSPVSKGKILSIDSSNLPEGYCFFSAKDIPGKNKIKTSFNDRAERLLKIQFSVQNLFHTKVNQLESLQEKMKK